MCLSLMVVRIDLGKDLKGLKNKDTFFSVISEKISLIQIESKSFISIRY